MVSDVGGNVRIFPNDNDGQTTAGATIAQNYGTSGPLAAPGGIPLGAVAFNADWDAAQAFAAGVPEPTALAALMLPAIWGMSRRRRA